MKSQPSGTATRNILPPIPPRTTPPPGLDAIYQACKKVYPDQPNPLQVTAVMKYWLGGPDPLDYISMYYNRGNKEVPEHWHYVTFGFSDLHGDMRVHPTSSPNMPSGFGFELTMRLKREPGETGPPTWPAELLQALARYVFQSENSLFSGDHVSWHAPLDNSESRITHMLMTDDPQLPMVSTSLGTVSFIQVVGVCSEELQAAQQWNGPGVIELLKTVPVAGGPWLVTDMRRGETVFEINPDLLEEVENGIHTSGSNLSGVSARCVWLETAETEQDEHNPPKLSEEVSNQIKDALLQGLEKSKQQADGNTDSERRGSEDSVSQIIPHELICTRTLDGIHLKFNLEAASLLPLSCRGRILHGRHFTFKSVHGDTAITLVATGVEGAFVNEDNPFAAKGPWLQVLISEDFANQLLKDLNDLSNPNDIELPKVYEWPERRIKISVLEDNIFSDPIAYNEISSS